MSRPAVSVCVPVYNVEKTLARCLDSILAQTLKNIEIICVNDGSTDDSSNILDKYEKEDHRIKVIHKDNKGLPSARNAALDVACGEFVGFVDSDDYIKPQMFQQMYSNAKRKNAEVVICGAEIFPEEPKADEWYYETLSPRGRFYPKYEPEIIYECIDTTPFLWRCLISKDLIDRNCLRLDEEVHLGEDKAFQAKVYPLARGICVIPDKLYNYCWYREGSLMEDNIRDVSDKKGYMHAKMITSMAENLSGSEEENKKFLKWSINFLYGDFLAVSRKRRHEAAKELIQAWNKADYHILKYDFEQFIRDEYDYFQIQSQIDEQIRNDISIILIVEGNGEYLFSSIKEILKQEGICSEIIVVNNGVYPDVWNKLCKVIAKHDEIRVFNTPEHFNYAECIRAGILLAQGEYIHFYTEGGWYEDNNALRAWYIYAKTTEYDVCMCPNASFGGKALNKYKLNDALDISAPNYVGLKFGIENALFEAELAKNNLKEIRNASIITGRLVVARGLLKSSNAGLCEKICFNSLEKWRPDWITTEKCEFILAAITKSVKKAIEAEEIEYAAFAYNILASDPVKQMIVNNTKLYVMPPAAEPEGKNSQYKTINALYYLMAVCPIEEFHKRGFRMNGITNILNDVMAERNYTLENLCIS